MVQGSIRHLAVKSEQIGKRADVFVAGKLPGFTRSSLKRLFEKNLMSVNSKPIKASYLLKPKDELALDERPLFAKPQPIELEIIYEDKEVTVLNKPAGVLTHSKGAFNDESTVASFIRKKTKGGNLEGNRAGIVHRLDRGTSGVIITAKNQKAQKWLQKQFSTRKVNKIYTAIVEGVPTPTEAIIDASIERNPARPQTFKVGGNGRSAQTKYKVIKKLNKSSKLYSLLELEPKTGRTHQLRVHLKYIGHPIVGDPVYGHGGERMYLHAKSLEIALPANLRKKFEAPVPSYFDKF